MYIPIDALILFQTTQGCAFAVPQEISVLIGHLTRDADLVAVEVMGLLLAFAVCGCPIADLCQRFVRTGGFVWATVCYGLLVITS